MANLENPTPLNVPGPAKASALPTAGKLTYATPHVGPPPPSTVSGHTPAKITLANASTQKVDK